MKHCDKLISGIPVNVEAFEEEDELDSGGNSHRSLSIAFDPSAVCRQSHLPKVRLDHEVSQCIEKKM